LSQLDDYVFFAAAAAQPTAFPAAACRVNILVDVIRALLVYGALSFVASVLSEYITRKFHGPIKVSTHIL